LNQQTTLERAFELAKSGDCLTISEIRSKLKKEQRDSVDAHLAGPALQRQLRTLLAHKRVSADAA
jgi:hypothetical protein